MSLPPRTALADVDPDDPLDYYYRPHTAWLYRARLRLGLQTLGDGPFQSLLEVGYGSGILLPELSRRAARLLAIDIHDHRDAVAAAMLRLGVEAELMQASLFDIPIGPAEVDAVVCLSVLEHITELDAAFEQFARVLQPGGVAVVGFPVRNPVTDGLFRMLGFDPREIHPSSHDDIIDAANRSAKLRLERIEQIPRWLPRSTSAYVVLRLSR
jgi:2-polyprenyl-6-hydroxyphenyl methylase/3-demethylubiquinone-9 3-methyltransferase